MEKNIKLQLTLFLYLLWLVGGCSNPVEQKDRYTLHEVKFISTNFLKKWNDAIKKEAEKELSKNSNYKRLLFANIKSDSLNSISPTRGAFLLALKNNNIIKDSLLYNTMYILELESNGERQHYDNYLIIDRELEDSYYHFEAEIKGWKLSDQGKGDFNSIAALFIYLGMDGKNNSEKASIIGPVIISKIRPNKISTEIIFNLTNMQKDSIISFVKNLYAVKNK